MIDSAHVVPKILQPAAALLPIKMNSVQSLVMLVAIGLQESGFLFARQMGNGPARGYWQFEKGGGVRGVMEHERSSALALIVCRERGVPWDRQSVWASLETDDVLAAVFARLLLWTDPKALPPAAPSAADAAWAMYLRNWRPGKPHPARWPGNHAEALRLVEAWATEKL